MQLLQRYTSNVEELNTLKLEYTNQTELFNSNIQNLNEQISSKEVYHENLRNE